MRPVRLDKVEHHAQHDYEHDNDGVEDIAQERRDCAGEQKNDDKWIGNKKKYWSNGGPPFGRSWIVWTNCLQASEGFFLAQTLR
jgi:hypothetical protein